MVFILPVNEIHIQPSSTLTALFSHLNSPICVVFYLDFKKNNFLFLSSMQFDLEFHY